MIALRDSRLPGWKDNSKASHDNLRIEEVMVVVTASNVAEAMIIIMEEAVATKDKNISL